MPHAPIRLVGPSPYDCARVVHPPPPREERDDDPIDGGLVIVAYAVLALPVLAVLLAILYVVWP
jgi:hypothetical protein